jgi:hypothetical protein
VSQRGDRQFDPGEFPGVWKVFISAELFFLLTGDGVDQAIEFFQTSLIFSAVLGLMDRTQILDQGSLTEGEGSVWMTSLY